MYETCVYNYMQITSVDILEQGFGKGRRRRRRRKGVQCQLWTIWREGDIVDAKD